MIGVLYVSFNHSAEKPCKPERKKKTNARADRLVRAHTCFSHHDAFYTNNIAHPRELVSESRMYEQPRSMTFRSNFCTFPTRAACISLTIDLPLYRRDGRVELSWNHKLHTIVLFHSCWKVCSVFIAWFPQLNGDLPPTPAPMYHNCP